MKTLLILLASGLLSLAAEPAKPAAKPVPAAKAAADKPADKTADKAEASGPKAIPADRQESLSRIMIQMQALQLQASKAASALDQGTAQYNQIITALQKEFDAEGCSLNIDKTWDCPKK